MQVSVAIITHRSRHHLPHCLPPLLRSPLKPRILLVNSSSQDGTVQLAEEMGVETLVIPRAQFNHGATREMARQYLRGDIVVMLTPDAYAISDDLIGRLIAPIAEGQAAVAYARQIPHEGADLLEAFARDFNYPDTSQLRSLEERDRWGVYTLFCSNSCAAWSQSALDEVGGFQRTLMGEDTFAVGRLLQKGHRIAYVAEAVVRHSHRYSLTQEFQRHFDIGLVRKEQAALLSLAGKDSARGTAYVKQLYKHILQTRSYLLPYAFLQTLAKWLGYQMGQASGSAPFWWKKLLSSQDFYWESDYLDNNSY